MSWIPLIAAVLSAIAIVVSVVAAYHAHRSATAAEDAALSARRSAYADQRQAALAEEEANRYRTPWTVERDPGWGRGKYRLINDSHEAAHDVRITGEVVLPDFEQGGGLGDRESAVVIDVRSHVSTDQMSVTWRRPPEKGGEQHGPWRHSLS